MSFSKHQLLTGVFSGCYVLESVGICELSLKCITLKILAIRLTLVAGCQHIRQVGNFTIPNIKIIPITLQILEKSFVVKVHQVLRTVEM